MTHFVSHFLTNWGKNEDEDEKIKEYYFDLWILKIKIRLCGSFHENLRKIFSIHFVRQFWLIKTKVKMKIKRFKKMSSIFEFSISELGYTKIFMKIWEKIFDSFFKLFLTNRGKTEDEDEKIWENKFDFWIIHIKIRLCGSFHENLRKIFLTHFVRHFWLIETKMKMKIKRFGIMKSIFEFSISELGYTKTFMKIWEKKFWLIFLSYFWLIEAKLKMKMKKSGKISLIFELSISKLGYVAVFMKIWEKYFWLIL